MVSALLTSQHAGSKIEFFGALNTALRKRPELADAALPTSVAKTPDRPALNKSIKALLEIVS